jgi:hypothetical protein
MKMRGIKELLNISGTRDRTRTVVCSAIRARRVIEFYYHGGYRTVEPFCLGLVISGGYQNVSLLCFQTGGFSDLREVVGWKLYRAAEMEDIEVLNDPFVGDRPGYDPDSVEMAKIYCCVTPVAGAGDAALEAEKIDKLPRYEFSECVTEEPPQFDTGDFTIPDIPEVEPAPAFEAVPEVYARPLTHNELMRYFRLTHPIPIAELYRVIFSGTLIKIAPERTAWGLRHLTRAFGKTSEITEGIEPLVYYDNATAVYARPLTHNELMRIFRLNHPVPTAESYLVVLSGPRPEPPPERPGWETGHFARLLKGFLPIRQTA